jgi:hypothetical protein
MSFSRRVRFLFSCHLALRFINHLSGQTSYWTERKNRRQFLIDLATSKGLDPFNPNTWTIITWSDVLAAKVSLDSPQSECTVTCIDREEACCN